MLSPSKVIKKGYEPLTVSTTDGRTVTGLLVEEKNGTLTLIDPAGGKRITIPAADVDKRTVGKQSLMPDGLVNMLSDRSGVVPGRVHETPDWGMAVALLNTIVERLTTLVQLAKENAVRSNVQDRYTTEQVATKFGKKPRTPQKWCRDRQVHAIRITRDGTYPPGRFEVHHQSS